MCAMDKTTYIHTCIYTITSISSECTYTHALQYGYNMQIGTKRNIRWSAAAAAAVNSVATNSVANLLYQFEAQPPTFSSEADVCSIHLFIHLLYIIPLRLKAGKQIENYCNTQD